MAAEDIKIPRLLDNAQTVISVPDLRTFNRFSDLVSPTIEEARVDLQQLLLEIAQLGGRVVTSVGVDVRNPNTDEVNFQQFLIVDKVLPRQEG